MPCGSNDLKFDACNLPINTAPCNNADHALNATIMAAIQDFVCNLSEGNTVACGAVATVIPDPHNAPIVTPVSASDNDIYLETFTDAFVIWVYDCDTLQWVKCSTFAPAPLGTEIVNMFTCANEGGQVPSPYATPLDAPASPINGDRHLETWDNGFVIHAYVDGSGWIECATYIFNWDCSLNVSYPFRVVTQDDVLTPHQVEWTDRALMAKQDNVGPVDWVLPDLGTFPYSGCTHEFVFFVAFDPQNASTPASLTTFDPAQKIVTTGSPGSSLDTHIFTKVNESIVVTTDGINWYLKAINSEQPETDTLFIDGDRGNDSFARSGSKLYPFKTVQQANTLSGERFKFIGNAPVTLAANFASSISRFIADETELTINDTIQADLTGINLNLLINALQSDDLSQVDDFGIRTVNISQGRSMTEIERLEKILLNYSSLATNNAIIKINRFLNSRLVLNGVSSGTLNKIEIHQLSIDTRYHGLLLMGSATLNIDFATVGDIDDTARAHFEFGADANLLAAYRVTIRDLVGGSSGTFSNTMFEALANFNIFDEVVFHHHLHLSRNSGSTNLSGGNRFDYHSVRLSGFVHVIELFDMGDDPTEELVQDTTINITGTAQMGVFIIGSPTGDADFHGKTIYLNLNIRCDGAGLYIDIDKAISNARIVVNGRIETTGTGWSCIALNSSVDTLMLGRLDLIQGDTTLPPVSSNVVNNVQLGNDVWTNSIVGDDANVNATGGAFNKNANYK